MAISIREANSSRPLRVMIYGLEGVGKSTFGAKADKPIFITPEGGVDQLRDADDKPSKEFSGVKSWGDLKDAIAYLMKENHSFKTVVLDSADWIEKLCHGHILANPTKPGKSIITVDGGYNAGYRRSEEMHRELIGSLSDLRDKKDMNIVITAHAHVKAVKDPSMIDDYDGHEIKCHEMVSSLWREWVDALLYVRFNTYIKESEDGKKSRAMGDGKRTVYTVKTPTIQAKNRYGLPAQIEFTEAFWPYLKTWVSKKNQSELNQISFDEIKEAVGEMYNKVTDEKMKNSIGQAILDATDDEKKFRVIHKRMKDLGFDKA